VYGVVGGAAIAAYMFWQRRKNAGSTASVTTAFDNEAQNIGWGSAPYAPGPATGAAYDPSGGGVDMSGIYDGFGAILTEMELQGAERFEQFQASLQDARFESEQRLLEQRATHTALLEQQSAAMEAARQEQARLIAEQNERHSAAQADLLATFQSQVQAAPPPAAAPPPPAPAPAVAPAPARPAAGTVLWHGATSPNMATIRGRWPGVNVRLIDNKGHKPGSSHRYVVVAA